MREVAKEVDKVVEGLVQMEVMSVFNESHAIGDSDRVSAWSTELQRGSTS